MLNTIDAYTECGEMAGRAMLHGDVALYHHHKSWLNKAIGLERGEDKEKAREAFNQGYAAVRGNRRPEYFK